MTHVQREMFPNRRPSSPNNFKIPQKGKQNSQNFRILDAVQRDIKEF